jgi:hypothetical protein
VPRWGWLTFITHLEGECWITVGVSVGLSSCSVLWPIWPSPVLTYLRCFYLCNPKKSEFLPTASFYRRLGPHLCPQKTTKLERKLCMEDGTRCLHWNSASLTRAQGFTEDNHFKFHLLSTIFLWSIMFQIKNLRECRFWPKNLHRESRSRFTGQISNNSPNKLIQTKALNNLTWRRLLDQKKLGNRDTWSEDAIAWEWLVAEYGI